MKNKKSEAAMVPVEPMKPAAYARLRAAIYRGRNPDSDECPDVLGLYRVSWDYDRKGCTEKGSVYCVGESPEDALEKFRKTDEYLEQMSIAFGDVENLDSLFKVKKVEGRDIRLPKLEGDDADNFRIEVAVSSNGESKLRLEYIVMDKN